MRGLMILLLLVFVAVSYAEKDAVSNAARCEDIGGNCQKSNTTCDGRVRLGKPYCKKKQFCCVSSNDYPKCPKLKGYFYFPDSDKCYKFLRTKKVNFTDAQQLCKDQPEGGLTLAHPYKAVELRDYMVQRFGGTFDPFNECWVNGQRVGTTDTFEWQDNGAIITKGSPLWFPETPNKPGAPATGPSPGESPRNGLVLLVNGLRLDEQPDKPYFANENYILYNALCEISSINVKATACTGLFSSVGDSCLLLDLTKKLSWSEARTYCQELGADLVWFKDIGHYADTLDYIQRVNSRKDPSDLWIGGSDEAVEGRWIWITGELMPQGSPFWGSINNYVAEPSGGGGENCCGLYHRDRYYMHDFHCSLKHAPVCQKMSEELGSKLTVINSNVN